MDRQAGPSLGSTRARLLLAAVLVLAATAALSVDVDMSRHVLKKGAPKLLRDSVQMAEAFGHGVGVFMILGAAFALAPANRRDLPHVAIAAYGAGLAANGIKLLVSRCRPRDYAFLTDTVWDTFGSSAATVHASSSSLQSFPSAHSATAAALAVALIWAFPRGKWPFAIFAALACMQRVVSGAHFLSDAFLGASLGAAFAASYLALRARFVRQSAAPSGA